jgi:hypothetical protein
MGRVVNLVVAIAEPLPGLVVVRASGRCQPIRGLFVCALSLQQAAKSANVRYTL